jgi:plasmid stabilization system protein ParE
MTVNWTESALADLRAIEAYIPRHSARYGRGMVERIFARTEQLAAV